MGWRSPEVNVHPFWTQRLAQRVFDRPAPVFHRDVDIEFIGVWDTVDAYGLPIDELKEAFAWVSRRLYTILR